MNLLNFFCDEPIQVVPVPESAALVMYLIV